MLRPLAAVALVVAPLVVRAQTDFSAAHNVTSIEGTWSSNPAVSTGHFCDPVQNTFNYPNNTGMAYSFTDTGFYEEALYRYVSNASNPSCIQATVTCQHGTYTFNSNGSMTLTPFASDGRTQVQDPCAATTNQIFFTDFTEDIASWSIVVDPITLVYELQLRQFDGTKMPLMTLMYRPPNMLPTQVLTGVNASGQTQSKRSLSSMNLFKRSAAPSRWTFGPGTLLAGGIGASIVSVVVLGVSLL